MSFGLYADSPVYRVEGFMVPASLFTLKPTAKLSFRHAGVINKLDKTLRAKMPGTVCTTCLVVAFPFRKWHVLAKKQYKHLALIKTLKNTVIEQNIHIICVDVYDRIHSASTI